MRTHGGPYGASKGGSGGDLLASAVGRGLEGGIPKLGGGRALIVVCSPLPRFHLVRPAFWTTLIFYPDCHPSFLQYYDGSVSMTLSQSRDFWTCGSATCEHLRLFSNPLGSLRRSHSSHRLVNVVFSPLRYFCLLCVMWIRLPFSEIHILLSQETEWYALVWILAYGL
nr:hypothetical protein [Morchella crassipes]